MLQTLRILSLAIMVKNFPIMKRYQKGIYEYRGKIPRAKSIHLRDKAANTKERIGDFEADTIIGKDHKQAIVTLVDRHSKFTLMKMVNSKEAFDVSRAILKLLKPLQAVVKTITSDNGKEFAYFQKIQNKLNHRSRKVLRNRQFKFKVRQGG